MTWQLDGVYVENCNCDAVCPCTWSNLTRHATSDHCRATLGFRVERGAVNGVDVAGRTVVLALETPQMMVEGNWRAGLTFDSDTSDEQMDALTQVFTGGVGGPMAGLAPLITEFLGAERAPMTLELSDEGWSLRVGDATELGGSTIGADAGGAVALTGIVAHPAGPVMTVTPSSDIRSSLFGIDFSGTGRSGFTAPFSWSG